jgi:aconitate hydratase
MVIAYALAGSADVDITTAIIGVSREGKDIRLADLWPEDEDVDAALRDAASPADYDIAYREAESSPTWRDLETPETPLFPWDLASTYLRRPPFASAGEVSRLGRYKAYPLIMLGDDITTDHISPAGPIAAASEAGEWLVEHGEDPKDLNVYAARRGNWEAMLRGLFMNRTVRNLICPDAPMGHTVHVPSGDVLPIWKVARRYASEKLSTIVVAGERYGAGSSRDWAAKGIGLLGVRAVLAVSFERIHRSNLLGMGVLPIEIPPEYHPDLLKLTAADEIEISAPIEELTPGAVIPVRVVRAGSGVISFNGTAAVQTAGEIETLRLGGIIPRLIRRALTDTPPLQASPASSRTHGTAKA